MNQQQPIAAAPVAQLGDILPEAHAEASLIRLVDDPRRFLIADLVSSCIGHQATDASR
jgi:hypothetical protein